MTSSLGNSEVFFHENLNVSRREVERNFEILEVALTIACHVATETATSAQLGGISLGRVYLSVM